MKRNYHLNRLYIHPLMMSTILVPMMYNRFRVRLEVSKFNRDHPGQTMNVINHRDTGDKVIFTSMCLITLPFTLYGIGLIALHLKYHPKPNQLIVDRIIKCLDILQFLGTLAGHLLCKFIRIKFASEIQDNINNGFYCGRNTNYYIVPESRYFGQRSVIMNYSEANSNISTNLPNELYYIPNYEKLVFSSETYDPNGTDPNQRQVIIGPRQDVYISSTSKRYVYRVRRKLDDADIGNYDHMGNYQGGRE